MFNEEEAPQPYHHGNVKEALITKAMEFIDTNETGMLSLRRLAREVGVSPSAVYNHFPGKNALLLTIKTRLYEQLNAYFDRQCRTDIDPTRALLDMCLAYYRFAREQPARFHMLFRSTLPMEWSTRELVDVSCHNLVRLRKQILAIYEQHRVTCSEEDVVTTTLLAWSQLHGIISLKNAGFIKAAVTYQEWPTACALASDDDVERLIGKFVDMTVHAIINSQYSDSHH